MKRKIFLRASVLLLTLAVLLPSVFAATEIISDVALTIDEVVVEKTGAMSVVSGAPAKISGKIVKDVPAEATCAEVVAYFSNSSAYILDLNYDKVGALSRVGTGYIITDGIDSYTIAVKGDLDGDTYVTGKDVVRARKLVDENDYSSLEKNALDYNKDGNVTESDLKGISNYASTVDPELSLRDQGSIDLGDDFYATIDSALTGYAVTAHLDGNALIYEKKAKDPQQIWHFIRNEEGTYRIENLAFKKSLDVSYSKNVAGTNVNAYTNHGDPNQKWGLAPHEDGYVIYSMCANDRVLDVNGGKAENERNIQIYDLNYTTAQKFYINKVSFDPSADYFSQVAPISYDTTFYGRLVFGATSLAVAYDKTDSTNVCVKTDSTAAYQTWKFENMGSNQYKITNIYCGKVLDVASGTMIDTTNIRVYDSNDTTAQRWYMYFKDGRIVLRCAKNQNFVVDVSSGKDQNNWNVQLYTYNGTAAQSFALAGFTTKMPAYRVADPYNKTLYATATTYADAKAIADNYQYLGYTVFDDVGNYVYSTGGSHMSAKICHNAKLISDFADAHNFTYQHSLTNPGYKWQNLNINAPAVNDGQTPSSSCDRFVDWTLWRSGYTNAHGNVISYGLCVFQQEAWLRDTLGFTKIGNAAALKPGDIVFTTYDPTRPGTPAHIFICASNNRGGNSYLRYDHGSTTRIQYNKGSEWLNGKAPFLENIGTADQPQFYFAYRAPANA